MSTGKWMKKYPAWSKEWPAGIRQRCPRCGALRPEEDRDGVFCPACTETLARRLPPTTPKKTVHLHLTEVRHRMAHSLAAKLELGKWPCIGCAHAGALDGEHTVICDYLADSRAWGLPKRPWPRPVPWQCLYHADRCDRPTDLSMETCAELTRGKRPRPVMDRETGKTWRRMKDAVRETGKKESAFRILTKEEREMLAWAAEHEAGERVRIVIDGRFPIVLSAAKDEEPAEPAEKSDE